MNDKSLKTLVIAAIVVAVGGLTFGYASLTQALNISTAAKVQSSATSWKIKFTNAGTGTATGDAVKGSIDLDDTTVTVTDVVLKAPGDTVSWTFDVTNAGEIDAKLSTITMLTPTVTGSGDTKTADEALIESGYEYKVTYLDGTEIKANDALAVGATKNLKITITLNDLDSLPTNDVTVTGLGATLTYVQA